MLYAAATCCQLGCALTCGHGGHGASRLSRAVSRRCVPAGPRGAAVGRGRGGDRGVDGGGSGDEVRECRCARARAEARSVLSDGAGGASPEAASETRTQRRGGVEKSHTAGQRPPARSRPGHGPVTAARRPSSDPLYPDTRATPPARTLPAARAAPLLLREGVRSGGRRTPSRCAASRQPCRGAPTSRLHADEGPSARCRSLSPLPYRGPQRIPPSKHRRGGLAVYRGGILPPRSIPGRLAVYRVAARPRPVSQPAYGPPRGACVEGRGGVEGVVIGAVMRWLLWGAVAVAGVGGGWGGVTGCR